MVHRKESERSGWESGTWGFLAMCLWASHITILESLIPYAIKGASFLLYLLEAVNPQPSISIRSTNVSFLFKMKRHTLQ